MSTTIWKLHTHPDSGDITQYCLDNHVAALGWSLRDLPSEVDLSHLTFADYKKLVAEYWKCKVDGSVRMLAEDVKENDILWIRTLDNIYYMGRVSETSQWVFNPAAADLDACNQVTNIDWCRVGDVSEVPGSIETAFISRKTLHRIRDEAACMFSEYMYDQKNPNGYHYGRQIELSQDNFYSLLSPNDCEDLLAMWLYSKSNKNYVCIPSTDKQHTKKYECVLLDAQTGKHIYIQVKKGYDNLDADEYIQGLKDDDEFYLLTTRGQVMNAEKYPDKVFSVSPKELFEFACDENSQNILPPQVKHWLEFAGVCSSSSDSTGPKGILFDTLDSEAEQYMLDHKVVAAWGSPARYVKSFSKGDYVFYYRKGCGVIAVGEVVSDEPESKESEMEHQVKMLCDRKYDSNGDIVHVSPSEIKAALKKQFFFASTMKVPFLDAKESELLLDRLRNAAAK